MRQQTDTKPEVVAWEPGEFGVVRSYGNGWQSYAVGSRKDAYAELERLEAEKKSESNVPH